MNQNYYELAVEYFNKQNITLAKEYALKQIKSKPDDIHTLKLLGFIEYQSEQFQSSLNYLEKITQLDENIAEINNLIGCIFLKSGDYPQSINFFTKSIENDSNYIDAYTNLAHALKATNHLEQAIQACNIALSIEPSSINALTQCSALSVSTGDFENAKIMYQSLISLDPLSISANAGLAKCYLAFDESENVVSLLETLKNSHDRSPLIRLDVTNELLQCGESDKAITSYFEILDDVKDKAAIYNNLASAYDQLENHEKAIEFFLKAISENDQYVAAYSNIGRVCTDVFCFEDAEKYLSKAIEIEPNNVNAIVNMGRLKDVQGNPLAAKQYFELALKLSPNNAMAHYNIGNAYHQLGDFSKSSHHYQSCLSIDPYYADAEQNLSINELVLGKFDTAWGHYFSRIRNLERGEVLSPITPGMSLNGKHVYFCRSQGIGDELFFLRFLPLLKKQDLTITYRTSKKTYSLFSQITEIDNLIDEDEDIPKCDYYFTIDDLPLILNIDDISKIEPTLKFKPSPERVAKIRQQLEKYPSPYTALTWRAGTQTKKKNLKNNQRDLSKILPIEKLQQITNPLNGSIIILQRDPEPDELTQLQETVKKPILDLSQYNDSLEDMLALLSLIDNYIGVSNTNMHLLAALDKTADVLIPFPPDWRWMADGNSTPWFPGFGVYRQSNNGDWQPAINQLITNKSV